MVDTGTNTGKVAFAAALAAVVIGVGVLAGWLFEVEFLKRIASGLVAMNPATAVAFILTGASLALFLQPPHGRDQKSRALILTARLCALVVTLIGLAKLVGILCGWDLGVDRWLFASKLPDGLQFQNSMAPNTALNFWLLGCALLFVDVKNRSVRFCVEFSVVVVGFGSLLAVLAYAYNIQSFYGFRPFIPMALHTAITFSVLMVAFLLSHTDSGLLAVFAGDSAGGTMARRLLPAAVLVPAVLGWLTLQGEEAGMYHGEFGAAVFAVGNIVVFTFLVCWSAKGLFSADLGRKKAEEAMRESEERFSGAFQYAPIGVALVSPEGRWLKVNRALCDLVGYSEAELLTRTFQDITHPEDLEADLENVRRMIAGEIRSYQIEKRYVHGRGQLVTVLLNVSLVRDGQGQPCYFIAQIQDITERKQAEEAQARLVAILEATPDLVSIADLEGRLVYVNRAGQTMLGIDELADLTKYNLQEFHDAADAHVVLTEGIPRAMRDGAWSGETELVALDGHAIAVSQVILAHKAPNGTVTFLSTIARDITERKRLEAQLFQSQKMETVGKLAGGIAHEFNSILTAIIGQSELLLGDLPAGGPLAKSATEISKAAGRAATLTRQLLAYGRKQFLQPETLDLNRVIASMEGMFHHLMGGDVDTQIVPAPGLQAVKADAGQIEQVIMNLAINAADAMPDGGKLTLETANVTLDQEYVSRFPELKAGEYVMLAITDTGAGMSEEVKARVFEPFFTTKGVGQGTGLGLSTCYGIVKQSGGHVSVYSEPGRGTTFKIYLPQVEQQVNVSVQRLEAPDLPRGTETILLVEDDPALREMAATLLRRLGYTVLAAANGIEALSLKQQRDIGHIDLLFTDVVMPHMSGKELSERVRASYPHSRILFTSAYPENAIVHQGVLNKGVALLQKPFTPSALAHKLREVLDQDTM